MVNIKYNCKCDKLQKDNDNLIIDKCKVCDGYVREV